MATQSTRYAVQASPTNPWAVSAFVLSLFAWESLVIALISAALALISAALALVALDQIKQREEGGRVMAQFARAFAILMMLMMLVCGGYRGWPTYASQWPLWPR